MKILISSLMVLLIVMLSIPLIRAGPIESIKETFTLKDSSCTSYKSAVSYKRELITTNSNGENITEIILSITNIRDVPLKNLRINETLPGNLSDYLVGDPSLIWEFDEIRPNEQKIVKYGVKKKISEEELKNFLPPTVSIEDPSPIKRINGLRISTAVVAILILAFLSLLHLHIIKKTI